MNEDLKRQIDNYLEKNNLTAVFPYSPGYRIVRDDFIVSWSHNYSTIVKRDQEQFFFKVAIDESRHQDLARQVEFMKLLTKYPEFTFRLPKLYDYHTADGFYFYLREQVQGELLGNCVRARDKFASTDIANQLKRGLADIGNVTDNNHQWHKTKGIHWIKRKIERTDANKQLVTVLSNNLWNQIKAKLNHDIENTINPKLLLRPLWGDPAPNNFIVENGSLVMIDYAPFAKGYPSVDNIEFSSFCIFSNVWQEILKDIFPKNDTLTKAFYLVFLIDRIVSVLWLESQNQLTQLEYPKEYYLNTIKQQIKAQINNQK